MGKQVPITNRECVRILLKEAMLPRIAMQSGFNPKELNPGPNSFSQLRRDGCLDHYVNRAEVGGRKCFFYDKGYVEEMWGKVIDVSIVSTKTYIKSKNPAADGFEFVHAKRPLY